MWRALASFIRVGSISCLLILALMLHTDAALSLVGLPPTTLPSVTTTLPGVTTTLPGVTTTLPSTTLPPTTLPPGTLTTTSLVDATLTTTTLVGTTLTTITLVETTLPALPSVTTAEPVSSVVSTVASTTTTTLADLDDSDSLMEVDDFCTDGSSLLESELLDCEPQMSTSTRDPAGFGGLPSGVVPLFGDDEGSGDQSDEEEEDEEEEAESSPEPAPDPSDEESPQTLIDRLLDFIDQILEPFDVEVAGIQLLSTTGLALMLLAAVATGLLLAGLGVLKLPDWSRRDD